MAKKKKPARGNKAQAEAEPYQKFSTARLRLDPKNPRLVELGLDDDVPQFDIMKALWDKMAVEELAMSIAFNGYFAHEPLFLEERKDGDWTVIEGNRRVTAVNVLLDNDLRKQLGATDLPRIDTTRRRELKELPGVVTTPKSIWRYLGFKHVNGPSTWGSYAKAQYIATVHNEYGVPLKQIAEQIGDYANTVERMYRGLMVIEQAEQKKVFQRKNTSKTEFYFNYMYTALDNANYRNYIGLEGRPRTEKRPVPPDKVKQLGELCLWLYGDKNKNTKSLITSQNPDLKRLGVLLTEKDGVKALREGHSLASAEEISEGDERLFRKALYDAKKSLGSAHGTLTLGFDPVDGDALRTAEEIEQLATELLEEMMQKRKQHRRTTKKRRKATDE